jgi:cathepsin E
LIVLDQVTFRQYKAATGAVEDAHTGMLRIPESRYSWLKTLDVWVQGVGTLSLSPNAQIWPRSYNKAAGGQPGYIYLVVANVSLNLFFMNHLLKRTAQSKRNDGVVLGMVFLERFYTYYDSRQHRVGFANTQHTFAEVN